MNLMSLLPGGEKISVGLSMSTNWTDPPVMLIALLPYLVGMLGSFGYGCWQLYSTVTVKDLGDAIDSADEFWLFLQKEHVYVPLAIIVLPSLVSYVLWNHWYHGGSDDFGVDTEHYIEFKDEAVRRQYRRRRIPMCELSDLYVDGAIAFRKDVEGGDVLAILDKHRDKFVNYKTTVRQLVWVVSQALPFSGGHGHGNSSFKDEASTAKEIEEHYNRGNAFFRAFMGNAMVYTSGVFKTMPRFGAPEAAAMSGRLGESPLSYAESASDGSLEQAQFNKMQLVCEKLMLKPGERFLDIGCGWGTLIRHAEREHGAKATGVTLSQEGKKYCDETAEREGAATEVLHCDYRKIPRDRKFDKIASIEMAEHIGISNFVSPYLSTVRELLDEDKGSFLMQVSGLRQGSNWEDIAWGLFMSRYIFPGADASTPLHWYVEQLERAGFEVHSVETIGRHYAHTLHKWYDNWMANKDAILSGDIDAERETLRGDRLFRMWEFFLAYSVVASGQGSATCYQILAHPNTYTYPRDNWVDGEHVSYGHKTGTFDYAKGAPPRPASSPLAGPDDASEVASTDSEEAPKPKRSSSAARRRRSSRK